MPIYAVTKPEGKTRIINAKSEAAALSHVARGEFGICTIRKPTELAALIKGGAVVEDITEKEAEDGVVGQ